MEEKRMMSHEQLKARIEKLSPTKQFDVMTGCVKNFAAAPAGQELFALLEIGRTNHARLKRELVAVSRRLRLRAIKGNKPAPLTVRAGPTARSHAGWGGE